MSYIPMKPLLQHCTASKTAHGAFNVNALCQADALIQAHEQLRSGVIIQVAEPGTGYLGGNAEFLKSTLEQKKLGAKRIADHVRKLAEQTKIPVVLHLDHGRTLESVKAVIDAGFSSVMIDGSAHPYQDNVELTREVVKYAHKYGVSVEGELGVLGGTEDDVFAEDSCYTNPMTVVDFFKKTGCDSLALSYGTKHGAVKGDHVKLRNEIVIASMENMRHEHIEGALVSHGSSLVPQYIVSEINALGGTVSGKGVPIEQLQSVIPCGISKINIDTDIRLATTRNFREWYTSHPDWQSDKVWSNIEGNKADFDYRNYLAPYIQQLVTGDYTDPKVQKYVELMTSAVKEIALTATVYFGAVGDAFAFPHLSLEQCAKQYKSK